MSESVQQPLAGTKQYFVNDWRVCTRTNVLTRGDTRVELENRLVLLLVFLVNHQGEVLSKDRIIKTIWQGKVVNDDSLAVAISHLRKALGDNSRTPEYIKTIPGVGYQLIATAGVYSAADDPEQRAALVALVAKRPFANMVERKIGLLILAMFIAMGFVAGYLYWKTKQLPDQSVAPVLSSSQLDSESQQRWEAAQQHIAKWTPASFKLAIQELRTLLQQVPDFAPAYTAMANAKINLVPDKLTDVDHCVEMLGLLNKSLSLNAQQPDALVMRGNILFWCARDYAAAERDYVQAMQLAPNSDDAPMQYAQLLLAQAQFEKSLQYVDKSRQLNPLNYSVPTVVWIYQMQGRDDLALKELLRIDSAEPGDRHFHISAQRVFARLGREQESFEHWLWLMRDSGYSETDLQNAQSVFASGGLIAVNQWLLARQDQVDLGQYSPPLSWARYAIAAGDLDRAMQYLEQAFSAKQLPLLWGNVDPAYDPVRSNPRFQLWMQELQRVEPIH
ncbi:winged helix-turn-helix domain-containing protein [Cellvibrio sp. pealriver]|uniref:winged helix-turn-helix domain-containing protein n=1 Tax=Cellvibrio sp. pealriver TaxID=1622269 RepID=UPI00066FFBDF|nr:winged helix-turn-helix domain-containing protein [Cellvibrio sp. pealriver]